MITVKPLQKGEEFAMLRLARVMHCESPVYNPYEFDDEKLMVWINLCLQSPDWLCLVAWDDLDPIGFIAVGSVPMLFSNAKSVDDLGLFVLPRKRGSSAAYRLVRFMEHWAKDKGACIRLGVTTGTNNSQTQRFLERFGYVQTGVLLTKNTTCPLPEEENGSMSRIVEGP